MAITVIVALVTEKDRALSSQATGSEEIAEAETQKRSNDGFGRTSGRGRVKIKGHRGFGQVTRFGAPMDRSGAAPDSSAVLNHARLGPAQHVPVQYISGDIEPTTGFSKSDLEKLSPEEREKLLRLSRTNQIGRSAAERKSQIAALKARGLAGARGR